MSRVWRTLFLILLGILALAAVLGAVAWRHHGDLALLLVEETPPPACPPGRPRPSPPAVPPPSSPPAAPAPPARTPSWEGLSVAPYAGRYAADIDALRRLGDLSQSLLDGVKDLRDASGLFPAARNRARFVPLDYADCTFREPFAVRPVAPGESRVEFAVEPLILGWWPARGLLAAALARVVLEQEASGFAAAPEWLKAGAALDLSGFGPVVETRALLEARQPPLQLAGPLGGDDPWLRGYWAFRALRARRGGDAARSLVLALRSGADWRAALGAAGETPEEFEARYREWAAAYLRDRTVNRQAFLDAVALLRQRHEDQALPLLEAFVAERPLDLYAGEARYYLNYARYRTGDYDAAARGFTDLLVNAPQTTSFQSKAHFFTGRCYQLLGYGPMAAPEYAAAAREPANPRLVRLAIGRLEGVR